MFLFLSFLKLHENTTKLQEVYASVHPRLLHRISPHLQSLQSVCENSCGGKQKVVRTAAVEVLCLLAPVPMICEERTADD